MDTRLNQPHSVRSYSASTFSVADVTEVLWRHKIKSVAWVLLVGMSAAAVLLFWPKKYESEAKLYVRLGREAVALDPTATTGQTISVVESRENQINSARDMLSSRYLLERVVEQVGAETILEGPPAASTAESPSGLASLAARVKELIPPLSLSPQVSANERAVRELEDALHVELPRNSSVMTVTCRAQTPEFAQQLLAAYLADFQRQYVKAHRTSGSQQFFADQAELLKQQVDDSVKQFRDVKNATGVVSIGEEQKALQLQRSQLESAQLAAQASLAGAEGTMASLQRAIADSAEKLESQRVTGIANTAADLMQQELYRLRIQLEEAKSKYNDNHPLIAQLNEQMRQAEAVVAAQPTARVQVTQAVNPSRAALELDLKREEAAAAAHRARAATLTEQLQALRLRLERLNEEEVRLVQLEREVELATTNYRTYMANLEQARIDQALADDRISPVNVVQPPSLVEKPASPRPSIVLALALVAAVGGVLGLSFGSEMLDHSLRSADDVEHQLGLPVLVTLPRMRSMNTVLQN